MSIYELYDTDEKLAEDGKWFQFDEHISVKIRRAKCKKSQKVRRDLEAPYKSFRGGSSELPDDTMENINTRHVAEGLIADWKGITTRNGEDIPYTPAAAYQLLTDLPDFRDTVAELSIDLANFRTDVKEEVEKN